MYLWSKPAPEEQGDDNNAFVVVLETGWSGSLLGTTGTAPSVSFGRAEKKQILTSDKQNVVPSGILFPHRSDQGTFFSFSFLFLSTLVMLDRQPQLA